MRAFIPPGLPPNPPVELAGLYQHLDRANQALGRLDGLTTLLPDTKFFLYLYIQKEALLSSQIEGTQSSLSDLLLFESDAEPSVPIDDVEEVSNYVAAMQHGLRRVAGDSLSLSDSSGEIHAILLRGVRGANRTPGEFRRSQNWVGGTRPGNAAFVPPPPERLMECLDSLERFLHDEKHKLPILVEAGLIHVQFVDDPPVFRRQRQTRTAVDHTSTLLQGCAARAALVPQLVLQNEPRPGTTTCFSVYEHTVTGKTGWPFFWKGTEITARSAADAAKQILTLFAKDRDRIQTIGRAASSALRVHEYMQRKPLVGIAAAVADGLKSYPSPP